MAKSIHMCRSGLLPAWALLLFTASIALAHNAHAASGAQFVARMRTVMQDPALYLTSTVPYAPLLVPNNTLVALYSSTQATIEAMECLIDASRREVVLQVYEYDAADEAAHRVFLALQRRVRRAVAQKEPLSVGIVISRAWPSEHTLHHHDIHGLVQELQSLGAKGACVSLVLSSYRGSLLSILHTKNLVVDNSTALVMTGNLLTHGGIAVDALNMAAQLQGPVVHTLRADWAQAFAQSTVDAMVGQHVFAIGGMPIQLSCAEPKASLARGLHAAVLSRSSRWAPWPDPHASLQAQGIAALLNTATEDIAIINPSIGAAAVQQAVLDAILHRGVMVTAVLSKHMNAVREHRLFGGNNAEQAYKLYKTLMAHGGPQAADKLRILWGSVDGQNAGVTHSPGNIHAKVTAIDNDCFMIGSTNFNWLSFNTSREVTVALMGEGVALPFREHIWPAVRNSGVPLSAQDVPACRKTSKIDLTCLYLRNQNPF